MSSLGERVTRELLPLLLFIGAFMSIGAGLGLPPEVLLIVTHAGILWWIFTLRKDHLSIQDIRFLAVPGLICFITFWSSFPSIVAEYDQAYHLQISNRILDRWSWEPYHQGIAYSFRPELLPGIAAVELSWSGEIYNITVTPFLLLLATGWTLQHLSEKVVSKTLAILPSIAFLHFPVVLEFGQTMLADVVMAGAFMCVVLYWLEFGKDGSPKSLFYLGMLSGCCGLLKYPYFYLGPWLILILFLSRQRDSLSYLFAGWVIPTGLFLFRNTLVRSDPLGPMDSQIKGVVLSATSDFGNYTYQDFLLDYSHQWPSLLLVLAFVGTALAMPEKREAIGKMWLMALPAIVLHGIILDFGEIRYSTPWLAILTIGIPLLFDARKVHPSLQRTSISTTIAVVLMISLGGMVGTMMEDKDMSGRDVSSVAEYRLKHAEMFIQVGQAAPESAVLLAGKDITVGLYAATETYRFGAPSNDPISDSIRVVEATHVFTHPTHNRFDFERNWTYLLGSPIQPFADVSTDKAEGYVWSVDEERLEQRAWWLTVNTTINGTGGQSGDLIWLKRNATVSWPDNTSVTQIVRYEGGEISAQSFTDLLSNTGGAVLCDTIEECSKVERSTHLDEQWLMWGVRN